MSSRYPAVCRRLVPVVTNAVLRPWPVYDNAVFQPRSRMTIWREFGRRHTRPVRPADRVLGNNSATIHERADGGMSHFGASSGGSSSGSPRSIRFGHARGSGGGFCRWRLIFQSLDSSPGLPVAQILEG